MKLDDSKEYDVFGFGNAIVDFLIEVDENQLDDLNMNKGQFHPISEQNMAQIMDRIGLDNFKKAPGGSASNIISGIAQLGGDVIFCGKVGNGEYGDYYDEKMKECGVNPELARSDLHTGKVISFITPDCERSFAACMGAADKLNKEDINEKNIMNSRILHLEGYQLPNETSRNVVLYALEIAKANNVVVSIDLNDAGIIKNNPGLLEKFVKENVDIIFANEDEAEAFTGKKDPREALEVLSEFADLTIVKNGSKGSYIKYEDKVYEIPGFKANVIDTTGAGDMYAAGFLFGLCKGYDIERSGKIGSFAASKVVEQFGARYDGNLREQMKDFI